MDGKWRIYIEGDGGFCRDGVQLQYDADFLGREFVSRLLEQKQAVLTASFTSYPAQDVFAKDLLNG